MITRELENENFRIWIQDGILFSEYKKPIDIDVDMLKQHIAMRHEISNGEKQYCCLIAKGLKSYSRDARDYATKHGQEYMHASVVILSSYISSFIYNVYIKINKPHIPFKAFKTIEDGVKWLNEIKKSNEKK